MKKLCVAATLALAFAAGPAVADEAGDLWKAKCKGCHGADGKANTKEGRKHKIDDLTEPAWQQEHSDAEIRATIADGIKDTKMKAYKDKLSPEEIDGLVRHIRTLKR